MKYDHEFQNCHQASKIETVTSFTKQICGIRLDEPKSSIPLSNENASYFGEGRSAVSLLNIKITSDMICLSTAFSWMQRSARFMNLNKIFAGQTHNQKAKNKK